MRVAGVIAEYNPFHNGHLYHLQRTRALTGCDHLVVVMAGCFTQRGEPALMDKWARARSALQCGADLVLELPALFAVRPAQWFARGGVKLLGALGLVDDLSFGCETQDIHRLNRMASLLREEPPRFQALLRAGLDAGMSYPRARGQAVSGYLGLGGEEVAAPNTVLALEYLRENWALTRPMRPLAVKRQGGYHDPGMGEMASASAIRAAMSRGEAVEEAVPLPLEGPMCRPEALDQVLLYRLRGMSAGEMRRLPDMPEGLEGRILRMAREATGRAQLIDMVKCKRYTYARISRALAHAALGMEGDLCKMYAAPPYARVLGFREEARHLMRQINRVGGVELVTDPARIKHHPCFQLERRATDLWGLGTDRPDTRRAGRDMTQRVVRL